MEGTKNWYRKELWKAIWTHIPRSNEIFIQSKPESAASEKKQAHFLFDDNLSSSWHFASRIEHTAAVVG